MKVKLSSGEVVVGCKHGTKEIELWENENGSFVSRVVECRATKVYVIFQDRVLARGEAVCSPHDNFSKRTGRLIATRRLIKELRRELSKEDLQRVFNALCPPRDKNRPDPKKVLQEVHKFFQALPISRTHNDGVSTELRKLYALVSYAVTGRKP